MLSYHCSSPVHAYRTNIAHFLAPKERKDKDKDKSKKKKKRGANISYAFLKRTSSPLKQ